MTSFVVDLLLVDLVSSTNHIGVRVCQEVVGVVIVDKLTKSEISKSALILVIGLVVNGESVDKMTVGLESSSPLEPT